MSNDTQIVKGILEGCILKIISEEELYGYKIVEILNNIGFDVNEATVYPILARLQNKGMLKVDKRPSPLGPSRKYYFVTKIGQENLKEFQVTWARIMELVNRVMKDGKNDQEK
ncbi:MAG: PadR family transcriptional regulator [Anaerolineaceae bacterium]|nr:PadR family transcriptional regulator [Anaerolineaceae bacterium]